MSNILAGCCGGVRPGHASPAQISKDFIKSLFHAQSSFLDQFFYWPGSFALRIKITVIELEEDPLCPAVIGRVGSVYLAFPVIGKPNAF